MTDTDTSPLVGKFFHTRPPKDCGCRPIEWQGVVEAEVAPGHFLVTTFSWLSGSDYTQYVVGISAMACDEWQFYGSAEWMNGYYEEHPVLSGRGHLESCPAASGSTR